MPRTQPTICGAPNAIAMPRIAPMHQPHDIRFAMAIPPNTMIRMMATGVSQARRLVCKAVAPVMKGDACAKPSTGIPNMNPAQNASKERLAIESRYLLIIITALGDELKRDFRGTGL